MDNQTELTNKNRAILQQVAEALIIETDAEKFGAFVSDDEYIQHDPTFVDGKADAVAFMKKSFEQTTDLVGAVHKVLVQGDIGAIHSYFKPRDGKPGGVVFMDIFRLRDGKLVERWNVTQPMPLVSANAQPMI